MAAEDEIRPVVLLGRRESDHVSIRVLGRMHPGADDFWDGNWLVSPIEVVAGGFRGRVGAGLRSEELREFRKGLERIYSSLKGEAVLESMEKWVTLRVAVLSSGALEITGSAIDRPGGGNGLSFSIQELNQSDLPAVIDALEEVQVFFPVIGTP